MKNFVSSLLTLLLAVPVFAQQAAIIGVSEDPPDGFSFVAITDLPEGTKIYFTTKEYIGDCKFEPEQEEVAYWQAPAGGLAEGQVVFIQESADAANTFTVICSGGEGEAICGTFSMVANSFNIGGQDELYLFSDGDDNIENGVDLIHSAVHHDHNTVDVTMLPEAHDPRGDSPCGELTIVLDELEDAGMASGHYEYIGPRTLPIWRESLENPAYYTVNADSKILDVTAFSGTSPAVWMEPGQFRVRVFPNPVHANLTVALDAPLEVNALLQVRDTHGRLLRQQQLDQGVLRTDIPMTTAPAGIYWLSVISSLGTVAERFVKE